MSLIKFGMVLWVVSVIFIMSVVNLENSETQFQRIFGIILLLAGVCMIVKQHSSSIAPVTSEATGAISKKKIISGVGLLAISFLTYTFFAAQYGTGSASFSYYVAQVSVNLVPWSAGFLGLFLIIRGETIRSESVKAIDALALALGIVAWPVSLAVFPSDIYFISHNVYQEISDNSIGTAIRIFVGLALIVGALIHIYFNGRKLEVSSVVDGSQDSSPPAN